MRTNTNNGICFGSLRMEIYGNYYYIICLNRCFFVEIYKLFRVKLLISSTPLLFDWKKMCQCQFLLTVHLHKVLNILFIYYWDSRHQLMDGNKWKIESLLSLQQVYFLTLLPKAGNFCTHDVQNSWEKLLKDFIILLSAIRFSRKRNSPIGLNHRQLHYLSDGTTILCRFSYSSSNEAWNPLKF